MFNFFKKPTKYEQDAEYEKVRHEHEEMLKRHYASQANNNKYAGASGTPGTAGAVMGGGGGGAGGSGGFAMMRGKGAKLPNVQVPGHITMGPFTTTYTNMDLCTKCGYARQNQEDKFCLLCNEEMPAPEILDYGYSVKEKLTVDKSSFWGLSGSSA